eukprot:CAMPEP_0197627310 /NCGR_PEP_ID=MMETSP1338-20131121/5957_1 /TAXON_ID=43686 ORGANISM="Pelagodinium beii, Strain RCC1491" /NCGR_SAMPLE_ID=MMETSP1338 /ASSEMBLY_ACC=CAM_ASM_000754 /LENGTH=45 /DNA_ID= /DNA_START= /DNA_END= /DNA_ORIENTATION=
MAFLLALARPSKLAYMGPLSLAGNFNLNQTPLMRFHDGSRNAQVP